MDEAVRRAHAALGEGGGSVERERGAVTVARAATRRLDELIATGWPVLVSLSNKDFVGETLDRGVEDRLIGTLATTAVSAWLGARAFRAHNVAETNQALQMVSAIRGNRPPAVARRGLA